MLARKASGDRKEAHTWAKMHGKRIRYESNGTLYELAALCNGKPLYYKTLNSRAAISTAANRVGSASLYNLDGAGITVGVWDGGQVLTTHPEFGSRITIKDSASSSHYHATHVGGTIGASGVDANAKGMAPSADIDSS